MAQTRSERRRENFAPVPSPIAISARESSGQRRFDRHGQHGQVDRSEVGEAKLAGLDGIQIDHPAAEERTAVVDTHRFDHALAFREETGLAAP